MRSIRRVAAATAGAALAFMTLTPGAVAQTADPGRLLVYDVLTAGGGYMLWT